MALNYRSIQRPVKELHPASQIQCVIVSISATECLQSMFTIIISVEIEVLTAGSGL
jgi:hypothetical protein